MEWKEDHEEKHETWISIDVNKWPLNKCIDYSSALGDAFKTYFAITMDDLCKLTFLLVSWKDNYTLLKKIENLNLQVSGIWILD